MNANLIDDQKVGKDEDNTDAHYPKEINLESKEELENEKIFKNNDRSPRKVILNPKENYKSNTPRSPKVK